MIVVSNTTPIIGLASIERFELLQVLFGEIVLARELNADWVLMDEKKGRRKLNQLGIRKIGTVGILLKAKQVGHLAEIRPDLEQLRSQGFSLSQSVVEAVLAQAGEK